ncbi:MAG: hypothetical protein JWQ52_44 [Phenylobacterium sp.]|jgi:hypothetical protein|nr:hypothetical protein [Phenylobacterium sp.]
MSDVVQTPRRISHIRFAQRGSIVTRLLFYGLDEAGETTFAEEVPRQDSAALRALAAARLSEFHAVELWDGPLCIIRLRRAPQQA